MHTISVLQTLILKIRKILFWIVCQLKFGIGNIDLFLKYLLKMVLFFGIIYWAGANIYALAFAKYVIKESAVPQVLINKGLNGKQIQQMILTDINAILNKAQYTNPKNGLVIEAETKGDFQIEYEGFNFFDILEKTIFFKKKIESGVFYGPGDQLNMFYSIDKLPHVNVTRKDSVNDYQELQILIFQISEKIIEQVTPITVAYYKYQQKDYVGCVAMINQMIANPRNKQDLADLYDLQGECFQAIFSYDLSIDCFKKAIKLKEKDVYFRIDLAFSYINILDSISARKEIDLVKVLINVNDNEKKANYFNVEGNYYASCHDYQSAIKYYVKAKDCDRSYYGYYENLGSTYANLKKFDSASYYLDLTFRTDTSRLFIDTGVLIGNWRNSIERKLNMEAALKVKNFKYGQYYSGLDLINRHKDDEAIGYFQNCLKIDSNFTQAYYQLGLIYSRSKNYPLAEQMYNAADKLSPFNDDIYFGIISNYTAQGNYQKAKDVGFTILAHNPLDNKILSELGSVYYDRKDRFESEYCYILSLLINPGDYNTLISYLYYKKSINDYQSVISLGQQILNSYPRDTETYVELAKASLALGNVDYAKYLCQSLMYDSTQVYPAHLILGKSYDLEGNKEEAFKHYRAAANMYLDTESVRFISKYYYNNKDYAKSIIWYYKLKNFSSLTIDEYFTLGWMLAEKKRYSEAYYVCKDAFLLEPGNCVVLKNWYRMILNMKEKPENDVAFRSALEFSTCDIGKWMKSNQSFYVK